MNKITQFHLDQLLNQTHYSWSTSVMLGDVIGFLEFSESNLSWQRRREIRKAKDDGTNIGLSPEDQHLAQSYRQNLLQNAEYKFDVSLSQRVRYSALAALITTLEWCAKSFELRLAAALPKSKKGENKQVFLFSQLNHKCCAGFDRHIDDLRHLIFVRNCVVHTGGLVDGYQYSSDLRGAVANLTGFAISDQNFLGRTIFIEKGAINGYAVSAGDWIPRLDKLCTQAGVLKHDR